MQPFLLQPEKKKTAVKKNVSSGVKFILNKTLQFCNVISIYEIYVFSKTL